MATFPAIEDFIKGFQTKNLTLFSRAITLVESESAEHRSIASTLLSRLRSELEYKEARVIGLSGTPGVGKSSFIEKFGMHLIGENKTVAVLAIDPSSQTTKGSILGDKTRMQELSLSDKAYIRPSPNSSHLGGVARKTRQVIELCRYFGFDYILVETVGVGQSETAVASMCDLFLLLMQTGGGDDLQGIKRGILELADLVIITKADGQNAMPAKVYAREMKSALSLLRHDDDVEVLTVSALEVSGLSEVHKHCEKLYKEMSKSGKLSKRHHEHKKQWFREICSQAMEYKVEQYLNSQNDDFWPEKLATDFLKKLKFNDL